MEDLYDLEYFRMVFPQHTQYAFIQTCLCRYLAGCHGSAAFGHGMEDPGLEKSAQ